MLTRTGVNSSIRNSTQWPLFLITASCPFSSMTNLVSGDDIGNVMAPFISSQLEVAKTNRIESHSNRLCRSDMPIAYQLCRLLATSERHGRGCWQLRLMNLYIQPKLDGNVVTLLDTLRLSDLGRQCNEQRPVFHGHD